MFYDPNSLQHLSNVFHSYIAGALRTLPELFVLYAPTVNSYKRYVAGSWAPTVAAWGIETRTPSLRVITGSPDAIRLENRVPGSDMNPYLGMAATLARGLRGIAEGLGAPPPARGNAYKLPEEVAPRLPRTLDEAIERFDQSALAHEWFGDLFVDDFVTMRRWEIQQYHASVSEWERNRYFEVI